MNKNKDKKLIISDLDGTLLNKYGKLTKFTIESIKKIINNGHIFCISTGRPLRSAHKIYKQLGLDTIISTLNGGFLSNPSDNNFNNIYFSFNKDVLINILENADVQKYTNYIIVENIYCAFLFSKNENIKINEKFINRFHIEKESLIKISNIIDIKNHNLLNPISVLISLPKKEIDRVSFSIKSLLDTFIIRMWNDDNENNVIIELNTLFSTKGSALKYLSCYYGISLKNTFTFGDGENDIEMIKSSGHAYAMKNALPGLKLVSYKITEYDNNNDGVVKELLRALNI